jgi:type VI protein secretion system component VasK
MLTELLKDKKHWLLLAIGVICLVLWWIASQRKSKETPFIDQAINWLPAIGGIAFASEALIKLAK